MTEVDQAVERLDRRPAAGGPGPTTRCSARRAAAARAAPACAGWSTRSTAPSTSSTAIPGFAVSIAAEVDGAVVAGVVRRALARRGVHAPSRGGGATLQRPAHPGEPGASTPARPWWPPASPTGPSSARRQAPGAGPRAAPGARHPPGRLGRARPVRRRLRTGRRLLRVGPQPLGRGRRLADRRRGRGRRSPTSTAGAARRGGRRCSPRPPSLHHALVTPAGRRPCAEAPIPGRSAAPHAG